MSTFEDFMISEAVKRNQDEQAMRTVNAKLLQELQDIADFAVGHGDVCEIIAKRARNAIRAAKETFDAARIA
jgi:hypothetical protein